MRKQCLFDSNHLIDEYGYHKHLLNCQSKLKKDWRNCKYNDTHWTIYNQIEFHEKYECPSNPLYIQDPKEFYKKREEEIRRRQLELQQKKNSKLEEILHESKEQSRYSLKSQAGEISFAPKHFDEKINFGQISMIEGIHHDQDILPVQNSHNHSILDLHQALNCDETLRSNLTVHNHSKNKTKNKIASQQNKDQIMFEKGITIKEKHLWAQPNFQKFEKDFRKKWFANKQNQNENQRPYQTQNAHHFSDEQDQQEISVQNISLRYNDIDYD